MTLSTYINPLILEGIERVYNQIFKLPKLLISSGYLYIFTSIIFILFIFIVWSIINQPFAWRKMSVNFLGMEKESARLLVLWKNHSSLRKTIANFSANFDFKKFINYFCILHFIFAVFLFCIGWLFIELGRSRPYDLAAISFLYYGAEYASFLFHEPYILLSLKILLFYDCILVFFIILLCLLIVKWFFKNDRKYFWRLFFVLFFCFILFILWIPLLCFTAKFVYSWKFF